MADLNFEIDVQDDNVFRIIKGLNDEMATLDKRISRVRKGTTRSTQATKTSTKATKASTAAIKRKTRAQRASIRVTRLNVRSVLSLRRSIISLGAALGAFLVARQFIRFTRLGIEFNRTIEDSTLGIASLISATGQIADEQGRLLGITEELPAAIKIATRELNKLRIAGLQTAATTTQLVDAFQQAVGPGLTAGIDIGEIQQLAIRIAQAAAAIKLPTRQLAEEIRSIFSGGIDQNTRLAKILDIRNVDVKRWKETGTLFEELSAIFEAFGIAGEFALGTFTVILSNAVEALEVFSGKLTEPLFESLKESIQGSVEGIFDFETARVSEDFQGILKAGQGLFAELGDVIASAFAVGQDGLTKFQDQLEESPETFIGVIAATSVFFRQLGDLIVSFVEILDPTANAADQMSNFEKVVLSSAKAVAFLTDTVDDFKDFFGLSAPANALDQLNNLVEKRQALFDRLAGGGRGDPTQPSLLEQSLQPRIDDLTTLITLAREMLKVERVLGVTPEGPGRQTLEETLEEAKQRIRAFFAVVEEEAEEVKFTISAPSEVDEDAVARAKAEAEKIQRQLNAALAQFLRAEGNIVQARILELGLQFSDLREDLIRLGSETGVAMIDALIQRELFDAELGKLEDDIANANKRLVNRLKEIDSRADAGLLTGPQRADEINDAYNETITTLTATAQLLQEINAEVGDPVVTESIARITAEIERLRAVLDQTESFLGQFADVLERELQRGLIDVADSLIDVNASIGESFKNMAIAVVDSLRRITSQILATALTAKILDAVGIASDLGRGFATGGLVSGPGTATSDSIPAHLSRGEFVLPAAAVRRIGLTSLEAMRSGFVPPPRTPTSTQRFDTDTLVPSGAPISNHAHMAVEINANDSRSFVESMMNEQDALYQLFQNFLNRTRLS